MLDFTIDHPTTVGDGREINENVTLFVYFYQLTETENISHGRHLTLCTLDVFAQRRLRNGMYEIDSTR